MIAVNFLMNAGFLCCSLFLKFLGYAMTALWSTTECPEKFNCSFVGFWILCAVLSYIKIGSITVIIYGEASLFSPFTYNGRRALLANDGIYYI